jgi:cyanobactin maturation PatA/PatG family protease
MTTQSDAFVATDSAAAVEISEPTLSMQGEACAVAAMPAGVMPATTSLPSDLELRTELVRPAPVITARATSAVDAPSLVPADCACKGAAKPQLVYAIGQIYWDFGSEARRDRFLVDMGAFPTFDSLVARLAEHPDEAEGLIWLLQIDSTPIYAIEPVGAFAEKGYELLREFLADTAELARTFPDPDDPRRILHAAIPGHLRGQTRLLSGQSVGTIQPAVRGMRDWNVEELARDALERLRAVRGVEDVDPAPVINYLNRVYFDLRNLGLSPQDRALNYAVTDAFNAARGITEFLADGFQLDTIEVKRSGYCRPDSDCWDVRLIFYYPEKRFERARKMYYFTVDVSDVVPVMVGYAKKFDIP